MDLETKGPPGSNWRTRRRFMFIISAFSMGVISYCLWFELDTGVADTAITFSFITLLGIVGCYVFGAAWEDIHKIGR